MKSNAKTYPNAQADAARVAAQEQDVRESNALRCVSCGCTDHVACDGGCFWVSLKPPRCSTCAAQAVAPRSRPSRPSRSRRAHTC